MFSTISCATVRARGHAHILGARPHTHTCTPKTGTYGGPEPEHMAGRAGPHAHHLQNAMTLSALVLVRYCVYLLICTRPYGIPY